MTQPPYNLSSVLPVSKPPKPGWVAPVFLVLILLVLGLGGAVLWVLSRSNGATAAAVSTTKPATAAPTTKPSVGTVRGAFALFDDDEHWKDGAGCKGTGGFSDIQDGAQLKVTDPAGALLALGKLVAPGTAHALGGRVACVWFFTITDVPRGQKFYGVEVSHRGAVQYSEADMFDDTLSLTLGEN